jgi:23S rRNA pseudouridine1911/1915/1917 synthase
MNRGFAYREQIDARSAGLTVAAFLAGRYPHSSPSTWLSRIEGGEVLLAGRQAHAGELLRAGDTLVWNRPPWEEPEVPLIYDVLYEDDDLLAVSKPSGLSTMPAGGFFQHTLLTLVQSRTPEASPMHRLGRGTSGVVLFARTAAARSAMQAAWRTQKVRKCYRALVQGCPPAGPFPIDQPIGVVEHPRVGRLHAAAAGGKASRSHVSCLEQRGAEALVEVLIDTGRPHQIRIHMAWAGFPLVGDPLYVQGGAVRPDAVPSDLGYLLHARSLAFVHPRSGSDLLIESPPPPRLQCLRECSTAGQIAAGQ